MPRTGRRSACLWAAGALTMIGCYAVSGHAQTAVSLPSGAVACLTQRQAADYQTFQTSAPAFAKDLLNRAACYQLKEPAAAITRGKSKGFTQFQLLSGHNVWLPDHVTPAQTPR